jgi:uncharacterized glyoxalase superfamily protein PhnB
MEVPVGYATVTPYLIVHGGLGFINFMENVFGAKTKEKIMQDEHTVMHAELEVGDSIIMLADSTEKFAPMPAGLFIYVEDADASYAKAIKSGAKSVMEVADQEYGRSGGVLDPYGNTWWITTPPHTT